MRLSISRLVPGLPWEWRIAFSAIKLPAVLTFIFALLTWLPGQMSELVFIEFEANNESRIRNILISTSILCMVMLVYTCEALYRAIEDQRRRTSSRGAEGISGTTIHSSELEFSFVHSYSRALFWIPIISSWLPMGSLTAYPIYALAFHHSANDDLFRALMADAERRWSVILAPFVVALVLIGARIAELEVARARLAQSRPINRLRLVSIKYLIPTAVGFPVLYCMTLLFYDPSTLAKRFGVLTWLTMLSSFVLLIAMGVKSLSDRKGVNLIALIVAWICIVSWVKDPVYNFFGLDTYPISKRVSESQEVVRRGPDIRAQLLETSTAPLPIETYVGNFTPHAGGPSFVVAAQGGGQYAAYHAALSLARLEDRCPGFHLRVKVLSGVSGGALGIGVFLAAVHFGKHFPERSIIDSSEIVCNGRDSFHERLVEEFFEYDFLTPVVVNWLSMDLMESLIPHRWTSSGQWLDRARSLERAIAQRWSRIIEGHWIRSGRRGDNVPANFFESSVFSYLDQGLSLPAVVFTSTIVETGEPVRISPILFERRQPVNQRSHHFATLAPGHDLTVASAVVLSARFPYVTPVGGVRVGDLSAFPRHSFVHLADGGYFENSGADALLELIDSIQQIRPGWRTAGDVVPIVFTHKRNASYDGSIWMEPGAPFRAAWNAGSVQGFSAVRRMQSIFPMQACTTYYLFDDDPYSPPLAWHLSRLTRSWIARRSGSRNFESNVGDAPASTHNSRAATRISLMIERREVSHEACSD